MSRPFSSADSCRLSVPRASSWAELLLPLRGEDAKAHFETRQRGILLLEEAPSCDSLVAGSPRQGIPGPISLPAPRFSGSIFINPGGLTELAAPCSWIRPRTRADPVSVSTQRLLFSVFLSAISAVSAVNLVSAVPAISAVKSPELPIAGDDHIDSESEVGRGMADGARTQRPGPPEQPCPE